MTLQPKRLTCALPLIALLAGCSASVPLERASTTTPAVAAEPTVGAAITKLVAMPPVAPDATPGTGLRALLDARIAVTWTGSVDGLAKLLAARLEVPYAPAPGAAAHQVHVQQPSSHTVADALAIVNGQLQQHGQLNLVQLNSGIQLEYQEQSQPLAAPVPAQTYPVTEGQQVGTHVTTAAAVEPTAEPPKQVWTVSPADGTLLDALTRWADQADWQVVWEAADDLLIPAQASYQGDFRDAVRGLFRSFATSLNPTFYTRNNVVRVTDVGSRTGGAQQ